MLRHLQPNPLEALGRTLTLNAESSSFRPSHPDGFASARFLRRACTQFANVEYLSPANRAKRIALDPLRSNSSSKASRRAADTSTRPRASCFKMSDARIGDVIDLHPLAFTTSPASGARADAYILIQPILLQTSAANESIPP